MKSPSSSQIQTLDMFFSFYLLTYIINLLQKQNLKETEYKNQYFLTLTLTFLFITQSTKTTLPIRKKKNPNCQKLSINLIKEVEILRKYGQYRAVFSNNVSRAIITE